MRWTRQCADVRSLLADGEVVWFWRSEAGAKVAGHDPADDGGNQAMVTGESTYKP